VFLPVYIVTVIAPQLTILGIMIIMKDFMCDFWLPLSSRLELHYTEKSVRMYSYSLRNNKEDCRSQERFIFEVLE